MKREWKEEKTEVKGRKRSEKKEDWRSMDKIKKKVGDRARKNERKELLLFYIKRKSNSFSLEFFFSEFYSTLFFF